jgi:hypothetical protein
MAHVQHIPVRAARGRAAGSDKERGRIRVRAAMLAFGLGILVLFGVLLSGAGVTAPLRGGLGISTSGYVTTLFLEPITYESADYYYDENNLLQYAGYIFHHGVDISGGCYAGVYPIYAAADGIVALAQYINDGYGTQVVIDHGFNIGGNGRYTYTFYAHMGNRTTGERYIAVSPGQYVYAGQVIGYQGNDGTSFGSCQPSPGTHLDWEVRLSNAPLNYGTAMRYSAIAGSHNFYVASQLTYGLPNPAQQVSAGPFGPGGQPTNTPAPVATWTPGACGMRFTDLPDTHWSYPYVSYLYCRGVISGYADGTFRPDSFNTRGQFSKMMTLAFGWNLYNPVFPSFSDVQPGTEFYQYIETAKLRGIIDGYPDGTFKVGNSVTRGQASKMLVLARNWQVVYPATPTFPDVPPSHWAYGFIETAIRHGIAGGYSDGTFKPNNLLTRAQLAKFIALAAQQPARPGK